MLGRAGLHLVEGHGAVRSRSSSSRLTHEWVRRFHPTANNFLHLPPRRSRHLRSSNRGGSPTPASSVAAHSSADQFGLGPARQRHACFRVSRHSETEVTTATRVASSVLIMGSHKRSPRDHPDAGSKVNSTSPKYSACEGCNMKKIHIHARRFRLLSTNSVPDARATRWATMRGARNRYWGAQTPRTSSFSNRR